MTDWETGRVKEWETADWERVESKRSLNRGRRRKRALRPVFFRQRIEKLYFILSPSFHLFIGLFWRHPFDALSLTTWRSFSFHPKRPLSASLVWKRCKELWLCSWNVISGNWPASSGLGVARSELQQPPGLCWIPPPWRTRNLNNDSTHTHKWRAQAQQLPRHVLRNYLSSDIPRNKQ